MSRPPFACVFRCPACGGTWAGYLRDSFSNLDPVLLAEEIAAWERDPHTWMNCPHCGAKVDGGAAMVPGSEDDGSAERMAREEAEHRAALERERRGTKAHGEEELLAWIAARAFDVEGLAKPTKRAVCAAAESAADGIATPWQVRNNARGAAAIGRATKGWTIDLEPTVTGWRCTFRRSGMGGTP